MRVYLSVIFGLFLSLSAFSQENDGPVRVEFSARAEVFQLVPCGGQGVMMFYESIKDVDQTYKSWVFIYYDSNLNALWSKEIPIFREFKYLKPFLGNNKLYLTFQKATKARNDEFNFQMIMVDLDEGSFETESSFVPENAVLINFIIHENTFIAGFNYEKEQALLLIRNLETGVEKPILFLDVPSFIEDVKVDPFSNNIFVALNIYASRKNSTFYLNAYNLAGNLQSSVQVAPTRPSEKLMNGQISFISSTETVVLGSFNNLNGNFSRTDEENRGEESEGFYIAKIENGHQKFIRFHKLLDFKNITKILNNEELMNVQNLINKEKKKGKEQSLNYEFLIHDLQMDGPNYLMLAEAYYPEYHQVSTMSYDFYGRPMPYYYTIFDGYRFFNAFAVSFDSEGNLLWSNGMKIWDMLSQQLLKKVEMFTDVDGLAMFYNYDGSIVSKVINGYAEIGNTEKTKISTSYVGDVQLEASYGMITHWYDNFFLAYGYQTLKNNEESGGVKRRVFYFNKIIFN